MALGKPRTWRGHGRGHREDGQGHLNLHPTILHPPPRLLGLDCTLAGPRRDPTITASRPSGVNGSMEQISMATGPWLYSIDDTENLGSPPPPPSFLPLQRLPYLFTLLLPLGCLTPLFLCPSLYPPILCPSVPLFLIPPLSPSPPSFSPSSLPLPATE